MSNILIAAGGDEGYQISRSVRLRSSASAYFNRTPASASNFQINTISFWVKRGALSSRQALFSWSGVSTGNNHTIEFTAADAIEMYSVGTAASMDVQSTQVFRDPSAWYHIVYAIDTTQATAANRVKLYVNGVQVTSFGVSTYPAQNANLQINANNLVNIGRRVDNTGAGVFDGYMTEVNFIDGQALTPSSFGQNDSVTGVWKPKKYAGTYGTNGFYLNFSDNSAATAAAIGKDYSGNGNNWTPNNISVTAGVTYDSMIDVPTLFADGGNGRGNYAVLSPIDTSGSGTIADGNLKLTGGSAAWYNSRTGFGMTSGKWYWEVTILSANTASNGICLGISNSSTQAAGYGQSNQWVYNNNTGGTGRKGLNGVSSSYGITYVTNDVVGIAFDADAGSITCYVNNSSQGVMASSGLPNPAFPCTEAYGTDSVAVNFGQRPFAYTPPTGFKALNTLNLPDSTIKKGSTAFDVSKWTGNGGTQSITGLAFQPDLVWAKDRTTTNFHALYDSVRGATKDLQSNTTTAEQTFATGLTSFNADGFTTGNNSDTNANGDSYVGWQWKKGATQGFDIVTYTGNGTTQNIAHSLGVAPKMIITKYRGGAASWNVYHASLGATQYLYMDQTAAAGTSSVLWNNTAPTSSVFTVGSGTGVNPSGGACVAYLFAEVAGFSKFGSYTGNGSADGPFVYCGFRPRFVLVKDYSNAGVNWTIFDTARDSYNVEQQQLFPNLSNAEAAGGASVNSIDVTANGFKIRGNGGGINTNADGYIFAAFAENPFKNSLAR